MLKFLRGLFPQKCEHYYPDYLNGVSIVARFPNTEWVEPYRECLYCRKRVPHNSDGST